MCRSEKWTDRQEVVKRITKQLTSNTFTRSLVTNPELRELTTRTVCNVVRYCLVEQSCYPVYFSAFELWWVFTTSDLCIRIAREPEEGGNPERVRAAAGQSRVSL